MERLERLKYTFTVEGETEQWYLFWLRDQINQHEGRKYNVAFDAKVQQSPRKFYKSINTKTTPEVTHVCDVESNDPAHVRKFQNILSEMAEAKKQKRLKYELGYSNFTFELWIVLHKRNCNGTLNDRRQYLNLINQAFDESFENLDQYKHEDNFKRCLGKLTLKDVIKAIERADVIADNNMKNGNRQITNSGYRYFPENPALSLHETIKKILNDCGIIKI